MRMDPVSLIDLNVWSPVGGSVSEGLGNVGLLGKVSLCLMVVVSRSELLATTPVNAACLLL